MTGKIMLITSANNLASAVYPDNMDCLGNCGLGKKIYTELSRFDTTEQFVDYIDTFEAENFENLNVSGVYTIVYDFLNLQKVDGEYLYVKNAAKEALVFNEVGGRPVAVMPGDTKVFHNGYLYAESLKDIDSHRLNDYLQAIKEDLAPYSNLDNYELIHDACDEYETEYYNARLLDIVDAMCFMVKDDLAEYLKENCCDSFLELKQTVDDLEDDDIYFINKYGKVSNLYDEDFSELIGRLQAHLREKMNPHIRLDDYSKQSEM